MLFCTPQVLSNSFCVSVRYVFVDFIIVLDNIGDHIDTMADDLSSSATKIEKLNDSNYHFWKQKIVLLLALKDLDDLIEEDPPTEKTEHATWTKKDRKARAVIGLSLSDEHLEHVRDMDSAKKMWEAITNVFERHTLLNKLSARRKFYTVTMEKGEKMLTYLNRVKQLAATLKSMKVDIDDKEIAMAALNGLPSTYEGLIVALDALGNDDKSFTFDLVKSRLLQEEQRATEREKIVPSTRPSALVGVSGRTNANGKRYLNHRCSICNHVGHTEEFCWGKDINGQRPPNPNPNPNQNRRQTKSSASRNTAHVVEHKQSDNQIISESDYVCLMAKINSSAYPKRASSWIVDSGCTAHICFDKSMFETYEPVTDMSVEMGTKATANVSGRGSIIVSMGCGSDYKVRKLAGVLHVPKFEYSLLSVSALDRRGMMTTFGGGECIIHNKSLTIATGVLEDTLYVIHTKPAPSNKETALLTSLQLWHERMGHVNKRGITQMAEKGVAKGLKIKDRNVDLNCHHCAVSKAHRSPVPKERTSERAKGMLDRVHSDVCGPMEISSLGGSRYFVTFIDEHSNWATVYLMKHKSEVTDRFLEFEKYAERQTGRKIRILRSDRGGEYLSNTLSKYMKHQGIAHELTTAYTPHQNGVSERFNRTILNLVRSMLSHRQAPMYLWAEALSTAVHIRNRVTSNALPPNITPHHIWKSAVPNVSHFRVFGCKCWYTVPKSEVQKLDPRGKVAIFVGYAENSKAYKLIDFETQKVVISRDVLFDELDGVDFGPDVNYMDDDNSKSFGEVDKKTVRFDLGSSNVNETQSSPNMGIQPSGPVVACNEPDTEQETETAQDDVENSESQGSPTELQSNVPDVDSTQQDVTAQEDAETVLRSGRVSKPPGSWWRAYSTTEHHNALLATATKDVPNTYKQAVSGPDAGFWQEGIKSEADSLRQHNTWTPVLRKSANGRRVFTTRWIFTEKQKVDEHGNSTPFAKGRCVVRGFQQVQGVDYGETFAPVVKYASVRALCAEVAKEDLELEQMDVKTAFLDGDIDEDIFIEVPEGFEITKEDIAHLDLGDDVDIGSLDLVCKLEKSMYGTKQAPRCWNKKINSVLAGDLGFTRSDGDPCLYVKQTDDGVVMIALYVDDLLIAAKSKSQTSWVKKMLNDRFDMKDLGEAKVCLGLEITRDRQQKKLWLTQQSYMEKIVERFGMSESKPVPTPMEEPKSNTGRLELITEDDDDATGVPYREAIGSLMYLMIGSRPDIAYSVGKLARFCENPKTKHWVAVKRVLRYICGSSKMGLCYDGLKDGTLESQDSVKETDVFGYCDSDWAGDVSDRKSTSAYVFMRSGAAISWCSKKQTVVATSSCEAEYIAMSMACKEGIWMKRLFSDIPVDTDLKNGIMLLTDSTSAMKLSNNESINRRNKHIDINYHFVRQVTDDGQVALLYIPTSEMVADMLTKPLGRIQFQKLRHLCGMRIKGEI